MLVLLDPMVPFRQVTAAALVPWQEALDRDPHHRVMIFSQRFTLHQRLVHVDRIKRVFNAMPGQLGDRLEFEQLYMDYQPWVLIDLLDHQGAESDSDLADDE